MTTSCEKKEVGDLVLSFTGPFVVFSTLLLLQIHFNYEMMNGSFGPAVVIIFSMQSPAARPSHIFFGQMLSGAVAIIYVKIIPPEYNWLMSAFAVATASLLMKCLSITYPPGGATTFIITQTLKSPVSWYYLLSPLLVGSVVLFIIAYILINVIRMERVYPDNL